MKWSEWHVNVLLVSIHSNHKQPRPVHQYYSRWCLQCSRGSCLISDRRCHSSNIHIHRSPSVDWDTARDPTRIEIEQWEWSIRPTNAYFSISRRIVQKWGSILHGSLNERYGWGCNRRGPRMTLVVFIVIAFFHRKVWIGTRSTVQIEFAMHGAFTRCRRSRWEISAMSNRTSKPLKRFHNEHPARESSSNVRNIRMRTEVQRIIINQTVLISMIHQIVSRWF